MARKDYSAALEALSILTQGAATIHGQHVEDKMNEYNMQWQAAEKQKDRQHDIDVMNKTNELAMHRLVIDDMLKDGNRLAEHQNSMKYLQKQEELRERSAYNQRAFDAIKMGQEHKHEKAMHDEDITVREKQIEVDESRIESQENIEANRIKFEAAQDWYNTVEARWAQGITDYNALEQKLIEAGIDYSPIADDKLKPIDVSGVTAPIYNAATQNMLNSLDIIDTNVKDMAGRFSDFNAGLKAGALIDGITGEAADGIISTEELAKIWETKGYTDYKDSDAFIRGAQQYNYGAVELAQLEKERAVTGQIEVETDIKEIELENAPEYWKNQLKLQEVDVDLGTVTIKKFNQEIKAREVDMRVAEKMIEVHDANLKRTQKEVEVMDYELQTLEDDKQEAYLTKMIANIETQKVNLNQDNADLAVGLLSKTYLKFDDDSLVPGMQWLVGDETWDESSMDMLMDTDSEHLAWIKPELVELYGAYHSYVGEDMVPDYNGALRVFSDINSDFNDYKDFLKDPEFIDTIFNLKANGNFTLDAVDDLLKASDYSVGKQNNILKSVSWFQTGLLDEDGEQMLKAASKAMVIYEALSNSRSQAIGWQDKYYRGELGFGEDDTTFIPDIPVISDVYTVNEEANSVVQEFLNNNPEQDTDEELSEYFNQINYGNWGSDMVSSMYSAHQFAEGFFEGSRTYRTNNPGAISIHADRINTHWAGTFGATYDPNEMFWDYVPAGGGKPIQVFDQTKIPSDAKSVDAYYTATFPTVEAGEAASHYRIVQGLDRHKGNIDAYIREYLGNTASEEAIQNYKSRVEGALTHTVARGDTINDIAAQYFNGDIDKLLSINPHITNIDQIAEGDSINIFTKLDSTELKKPKKEEKILSPDLKKKDKIITPDLNPQNYEPRLGAIWAKSDDKSVSKNLSGWSDALEEEWGTEDNNTFGFSKPKFHKEDGKWMYHIPRRGEIFGFVPWLGDYMSPDLRGEVHGIEEGRPYIDVATPAVGVRMDPFGMYPERIYLDDTYLKLGYKTKSEYFWEAMKGSAAHRDKLKHLEYQQ